MREEAVKEMEYNTEWSKYYRYLEGLRQSGVTNMYGSSAYLEECFGLGRKESSEVLASWMNNYGQLVKDGVIVRE